MSIKLSWVGFITHVNKIESGEKKKKEKVKKKNQP